MISSKLFVRISAVYSPRPFLIVFRTFLLAIVGGLILLVNMGPGTPYHTQL